MECPPAHHVDTLTRALTYSALNERVILAPRGLRNSRTFRFSINRERRHERGGNYLGPEGEDDDEEAEDAAASMAAAAVSQSLHCMLGMA